jgi:hypothetical protein
MMPGPTRRGQGMGWLPVPGELPVDSSSMKEATNVFRMLDLGSGGMWKSYARNVPRQYFSKLPRAAVQQARRLRQAAEDCAE